MQTAFAVAAGIMLALIVALIIAGLRAPKQVRRNYEAGLPVYTGPLLTMAQRRRLKRIRRITLDGDAILQRVCRGSAASRDIMYRETGMSARRWTYATGVLRELHILSAGGTESDWDLEDAQNQLSLWYQARRMRIAASPDFVPGHYLPDHEVVTPGSGSFGIGRDQRGSHGSARSHSFPKRQIRTDARHSH